MSVDGHWGPTIRGGRRGWGRRLGLVALLLLLLLVGSLVALGLWLSGQLPREQVDGLASGGSPTHILVVGTDSRGELSEEEQRELGVGGVGGQRADTIFLMTIRGGEVAMLAFPRDLYVERCDGSVGRINAAIGTGPGCMVDTVERVSGIRAHHFVRVTFGGFVDVVDAVGGVELCLEQAIEDDDAHIDLPAGCQVLNGPDALGYVRVRKIDNDLQRIERQQEFLQALAGKAATPATLLNPLRVYGLGSEVGDAVSVDEQLGPLDMLQLARGARGLASGNVAVHTVPTTPAQRGGAAVLLAEEVEAEVLYSQFRDGTILGSAASGVQPDDVTVTVRNGTSVGGLAGDIGELLESRGYQVTEIGNTEDRQDTLLLHPPGEREAAELVAGNVPGEVTIRESADAAHVQLLLGPPAAGGP